MKGTSEQGYDRLICNRIEWYTSDYKFRYNEVI